MSTNAVALSPDLTKPTALQQIKKNLGSLVTEFGAQSAIVYVRDPHWTNGFRLVAMPGVRHTEPMHGFNFPLGFDVDRPNFQRELYGSASKLAQIQPVPPKGLKLKHHRLFAGFSKRENVKTVARLTYPFEATSRAEAVLYLNFKKQPTFSKAVRRRIREHFQWRLVPFLEEARSELMIADAEALSKSVRILSPDKTIAIQDVDLLSTGVETYLEKILLNTFEAFGLDPHRDLGTIYLLDVEKDLLTRAALLGEAPSHIAKETLSLAGSSGVVAWVVHRKTGLLIEDLTQSDYRGIHINLKPSIRSELAVPMILGDEVIGVICLESTTPNKFTPTDVRPIWYAANRAAVACGFYQQLSLNHGLLRLCHEATSSGADEKSLLERLASQAKMHLNASECDIWRFDPRGGALIETGASYAFPDLRVRVDGWTRFVLKSAAPVWIHDIQAVDRFGVAYFYDDCWHTDMPTPKAAARRPRLINEMTVESGARSELGLPIRLGSECIGVAWITFNRRNGSLPGPRLMRLATGFISEAGLLIEALEGRRDRARSSSLEQGIREQMRKHWQLEPNDGVDAAVATQPAEAMLGGDFYAGVRIADGRIGILLGDGEGHATRGSLNMLALWSAFEATRESCSTVHVMERIAQMAKDVGVRGTAVYGILTRMDDSLSLSATSAGHDPFLIVRSTDGQYPGFDIPGNDSVAKGLMFGVKANRFGADRFNLRPGDVVVAYTDGVSDRISRQQIHDLARAAIEDTQSASQLANIILNRATEAARRAQDGKVDDATVVVVKIK